MHCPLPLCLAAGGSTRHGVSASLGPATTASRGSIGLHAPPPSRVKITSSPRRRLPGRGKRTDAQTAKHCSKHLAKIAPSRVGLLMRAKAADCLARSGPMQTDAIVVAACREAGRASRCRSRRRPASLALGGAPPWLSRMLHTSLPRRAQAEATGPGEESPPLSVLSPLGPNVGREPPRRRQIAAHAQACSITRHVKARDPP